MKRRIVSAILGVSCGIGAALIIILNGPSAHRPKHAEPPVARPEALRAEPLDAPFHGLKALATPMPEPKSGEWLAVAPEEGQSFAEFKADGGSRNKGRDGVIYLVPVGTFDPGQQRVFDRAAEVTGAYYQSKVQMLKPLDAEALRKIAEPRKGAYGEQWLAPKIIDELKKISPEDSIGLLGITAVDLYPDPAWNFVFGQADNVDNVGVMSMARYGDPATRLDVASRRMSSVAVHELGHMFGVYHCVAWRCAMNGANSQLESDATPIELCPADFAKFAWYFGFDPRARTQAVHDIYLDAGFDDDATFAEKELLLLPEAGAADTNVSGP